MSDTLSRLGAALIVESWHEPAKLNSQLLLRMGQACQAASPTDEVGPRPVEYYHGYYAGLRSQSDREKALREALNRATIRSYSHKQRDLCLEFESSDDLTAVVTSIGCALAGEPPRDAEPGPRGPLETT